MIACKMSFFHRPPAVPDEEPEPAETAGQYLGHTQYCYFESPLYVTVLSLSNPRYKESHSSSP